MICSPFVRAAVPSDAVAIQTLYRQLIDDENVNVTAATFLGA